MIPDWKDAPEWAEWVAMDEDGTWWWHEHEPRAVSLLGDNIFLSRDRVEKATLLHPEWRDSKQQRPQPTQEST